MFTYTQETEINPSLAMELAIAADLVFDTVLETDAPFTLDSRLEPASSVVSNITRNQPLPLEMLSTALALTARLFASVTTMYENQTRAEALAILADVALRHTWNLTDADFDEALVVLLAMAADEPIDDPLALDAVVPFALTLSSMLAYTNGLPHAGVAIRNALHV